MKAYANVILDDNLEKPLEYEIPQKLIDILKPGMRVKVPVRNSFRKALVLEIKDKSSFTKVKEIKEIISEKVITTNLLSLAFWMSKYYGCSYHKALKLMVPSSIKNDIKKRENVFLKLNQSKEKTLSICRELNEKKRSQAQVLELFLKIKKGIFLKDLLKITNSSKSPIDSLIKKKYLKKLKIIEDNENNLLHFEYFKTRKKTLNIEQKKAYTKIVDTIEKNKYETHLLFGVTGSGKTEIYLQAIEKVLSMNKTAIMLVPEISLTSQTIERFKSRFDENIAIIHHRRSQGEKTKAWEDIIKGKAKIVIGARSAIFSPLKNLGIIIVDEEHDQSYKQNEKSPSYHAKNIAAMRGKRENCCVVLSSATPSFESFYNAKIGKYTLSTLKNRAKKATLPKVEIVDMKIELDKNKGFTHFSESLLRKIENRYKKGEQTLLFLNRRGYHNFLMCKKCSYVIKCPHCDISLTFHKRENILSCHSCEYKILPLKACPICKNTEHMQYKGYGTEHVEASLKAIFPDIKTLRMDRDTTTGKYDHEKIFQSFKAHKADVLIGTQMIVKGLHFSSVTLVGVLNTDGALNIPDFRAEENIFQLITQVSGRAGREEMEGEVIIQSFMPNHPTINLAKSQDYETFYEKQMQVRELFNYPPYTNMIKINFSSLEEKALKNFGEKFRLNLIKILPKEINIHPLIPSGQLKSKDKYRYHFLIRGKNISKIVEKLLYVKNKETIPPNITIFFDIDPISTFF